jgi:Kef-type K+ transport system membrane component KefB/voltage-gated potassium channel Kch
MDNSIFHQLSLVLALAAVISLLARLFRQPPIIGYMASGFLVGPAILNVIHAEEAFESFSQIGVALLLFMVGLGLNVAVVRSTGKPVLITFLAITLGLGTVGYGASWLLGFTVAESLLMATALLFSSTIIVVKALSDKKGQSRLYGQLAIGILLLEDIVATIALLVVSASSGNSTSFSDLGLLVVKGLGLASGLAIVGAYIVPKLTKLLAKNQELLFLFSLAYAFGVATAFSASGFSIEVGALFAGVSLAHLPYAQEMGTRLKPLRDFFIILFFIGLGLQMDVSQLSDAILPALLFSALVMVLKPILTLASLGMLGYTKQTGFKAAVHLSQISEFSIVLIVLAYSTGLASENLIAIMTLTALITITCSTYLIQFDTKLYRRFQKTLSIFERSETKRELSALEHYPLVLLGYHKGGHEYVRTFKAMKKPYVVIDFDPEVAEELQRLHVNHIYGDATDLELLDEIGVHHSELVVSTIGDSATNGILVSHITRRNKDALFICHASSLDEAARLYEKGAAYVILPHFIGAEQINSFIREHGSDKKAFASYRMKHLVSIGKIASRN